MPSQNRKRELARLIATARPHGLGLLRPLIAAAKAREAAVVNRTTVGRQVNWLVDAYGLRKATDLVFGRINALSEARELADQAKHVDALNDLRIAALATDRRLHEDRQKKLTQAGTARLVRYLLAHDCRDDVVRVLNEHRRG